MKKHEYELTIYNGLSGKSLFSGMLVLLELEAGRECHVVYKRRRGNEDQMAGDEVFVSASLARFRHVGREQSKAELMRALSH